MKNNNSRILSNLFDYLKKLLIYPFPTKPKFSNLFGYLKNFINLSISNKTKMYK